MIFERLKKIILENNPDIDISSVCLQSRLDEDLGIDSIGKLMLSVAIEEEFHVSLNTDINFLTVQDVVDFISERGEK